MSHDTYDDAVVMMLLRVRTSMTCPLDLALAANKNYRKYLWEYTAKSGCGFVCS